MSQSRIPHICCASLGLKAIILSVPELVCHQYFPSWYADSGVALKVSVFLAQKSKTNLFFHCFCFLF